MKKLLLLPIILFVFNTLAMDHLDEAQKLFEQCKASEVKEASLSSFSIQQQEKETSESADSDSKDYTWHSDLDEHQWSERYGCKYCPENGCQAYGYKYWPAYVRKDLPKPRYQRVFELHPNVPLLLHRKQIIKLVIIIVFSYNLTL